MYIFKQLPLKINNYINEFVLEQIVKDNFKKVINQIKHSFNFNQNKRIIFEYDFEFENHFDLKKTNLLTFYYYNKIYIHTYELLQYIMLITNIIKKNRLLRDFKRIYSFDLSNKIDLLI